MEKSQRKYYTKVHEIDMKLDKMRADIETNRLVQEDLNRRFD